MLKICNRCSTEKPEEKFYWKIKGVKRSTYCSNCQNEFGKQNYTKNKEQYLKRVRKNNIEYIKNAQDYVFEYLLDHPCVDCGESEPLLLEFDHFENKINCISELIRQGCTVKNLEKEMQKCQIRCLVCHRRKTAKDFSHYRFLKQQDPKYLDKSWFRVIMELK